MVINQTNMVDLLETVRKDNDLRRFTARVFFVNRFDSYCQLVGSLTDMADMTVDLSDYCSGDEAYPNISQLMAVLDENKEKTILIKSMGEYLRICLDFEKKKSNLNSLIKRQVHSKARIWMPIFAAENLFQSVVTDLPEERFDDALFELAEEPSGFECYVYSKAFAKAPGMSDVVGIKNWIRLWDDLSVKSGMSFSTKKIATIYESKGDYNLHIVTNPFTLINQSLNEPNQFLTESMGTEDQWAYLAGHVKQANGSLTRMLCAALNVVSFDPLQQITGWNSIDSKKQWLVWLWYHLGLHKSNDYITLAVLKSSDYTDIQHQIECAILDIDPQTSHFDRMVALRSKVIERIPITELSQEYWKAFDALTESRTQLKLMTNRTHAERTKIISIVSEELKTSHSIESIKSILFEKFPMLYSYLQAPNYIDGQLADFINSYKLHKVQDVFDDVIEEKAAMIDINAYDTRAKLLNDISCKGKAWFYWVDGMGIEWIDLLLKEINALLPSLDLKYVKIGSAVVPSVTSVNMEAADPKTVSYKYDYLDSTGHVKDKSDINYFSIIDKQFEQIQKIAADIVDKFSSSSLDTLVITADHGMSRMAAKAFHSGKTAKVIPSGSPEVCSLGRYCVFDKGSHTPSATSTQIRENNVIAFKTYDHFSCSGYAPGEIHGGASPEEILVPVIVFTRKQQEGKSSPASPIAYTISSNKPLMTDISETAIEIKTEEQVNDLSVMIGNKTFKGIMQENGVWRIAIPGVKPNLPYNIRVMVNGVFSGEPIQIIPQPKGIVIEELF